MSDEYEGLPRSFAKLCREADAKQRRKGVDPHLELLRKLTANDVSLERVWHELNTAHISGHAASSTVEALMYSLRERGTKALDEPETFRRLSELSDEQLRDVAVRLQRLKPEIAKAWTPAEIEVLTIVRSKAHAS
jgi:hypothetical protein